MSIRGLCGVRCLADDVGGSGRAEDFTRLDAGEAIVGRWPLLGFGPIGRALVTAFSVVATPGTLRMAATVAVVDRQ
jgi:hypothetical protein